MDVYCYRSILKEHKLGWTGTHAIADLWKILTASLPLLKRLNVHRCFKQGLCGEVKGSQLHVFTNASELGYGAGAYLRLVDKSGSVSCKLVLGKSRVVPIAVTPGLGSNTRPRDYMTNVGTNWAKGNSRQLHWQLVCIQGSVVYGGILRHHTLIFLTGHCLVTRCSYIMLEPAAALRLRSSFGPLLRRQLSQSPLAWDRTRDLVITWPTSLPIELKGIPVNCIGSWCVYKAVSYRGAYSDNTYFVRTSWHVIKCNFWVIKPKELELD